MIWLLGGIAALVAIPIIGLLRMAFAGFLLSAAIAPFAILRWTYDAPYHTGISDSTPSISTYTVMLSLLALGLTKRWKRSGWILGYGLAISGYLIIGLFAAWSGAEAQWAGAIQLSFAVLALAVGFQFGSQLSGQLYRYAIVIVFIIFALNGIAIAAQLAGLPLSLFPGQLSEHITNSRVIGTFSHPSTFGKFALFMLIVILPALRSQDRVTRLLAWWCVLLAVPLVALTLSRANLAAMVVAIALWLFLDRRSWAGDPKKMLLLVAAFAVSTPVMSATLERFSTDPGGGDRASIYRTGLKQLSSNLLVGTGPNYYTEDVGRWDRMTAWGFPLHNSFLYPVAELGIVGGVLFILPVFVVCAIAVVDIIGRKNPTPWSKAYLVTFPGIVAISMTGWGMLNGSTLLLWYFVIGVSVGGMTRKDDSSGVVSLASKFHGRSGRPASALGGSFRS